MERTTSILHVCGHDRKIKMSLPRIFPTARLGFARSKTWSSTSRSLALLYERCFHAAILGIIRIHFPVALLHEPLIFVQKMLMDALSTENSEIASILERLWPYYVQDVGPKWLRRRVKVSWRVVSILSMRRIMNFAFTCLFLPLLERCDFIINPFASDHD